MDHIVDIIGAGIIQGVTEFIPVSSSAHLVLLRHWMPYHPGAAFDVLLHLGTLLAVLWVFRDKILSYVTHLDHLLSPNCPTAKEIRCIIVASLPVILSGALIHTLALDSWRDHVGLMGINSIIFGLWLGWADHGKTKTRSITTLTLKDSFIVGLFQALAVIPGVSRSGACLTGLRSLGFERFESVRWTFLLSIPSVGGAVVLKAPILWHAWTWSVPTVLGPLVALVAGLGCIHGVFQWVKNHSLKAFVVYRVLLGIVLLGYWFHR